MKKCLLTPLITGVALFVLFFSFVFPGVSIASDIIYIEDVSINEIVVEENDETPGLNCDENSSEDCYEEDNDYSEEELSFLNSDDSHDMDLLKNFEGVIRQSNENSCGPAAFATLLTQMGFASSESQIEELAPANAEVGVSLYALKTAAISLGYETRLKKWTMDQMKARIIDTENPILIHDIKPNTQKLLGPLSSTTSL